MKFQKIICENKQFNSKKIDGKELLPSIFFLKPIEFCYHLIYNVYRNTSKLVSKVKKSKKDGAIVLMHDIHMSTAKAIKPICRDLNQSGYEAVTVTELAAIKGKKIVTGKTYFSF